MTSNRCPMCNHDEAERLEVLKTLAPFAAAHEMAVQAAQEDPEGDSAQMLARNSKLTQCINACAALYRKMTQQ